MSPLSRLAVFSLLFLTAVTAACATGDVDPRDAATDLAPTVDSPLTDAAVAQPDSSVAPTDSGDTTDSTLVTVDTPPTADAGRCVANNDGVLQRSELNFIVGASVLYVTNDQNTVVSPVDVNGTIVDGERVWNYASARPTDRRILDDVRPPNGLWWSGFYPDATFATVIDREDNILGVYRANATSLELLATVSTEMGRTNLRFTPPVLVLRFPLREGDSWSQSVNGVGTLNYTAFANVSQYTNRVNAHGMVSTPAGSFFALRLDTSLDQSVPLTVFRVQRRTYTFVSECLGVVARVTSVDNDTAENFTRASEYRRLGL